MKFNVEMDKKELKRFMGRDPLSRFFSVLNKEIKKAVLHVKHSSNLRKALIACLFGLILLLPVMLSWLAGHYYEKGFVDGRHVQKNLYASAQKQQTIDLLEDRSLKDVASWFAKSVLISIGNNLVVLFIVVSFAWLFHGVGFRII